MNEKVMKLLKVSKNYKLLYVEDCDDARESTLNLLVRFFNEVITGVNGVDGLNKFQKHRDFDIILTDINMPKMDGLTMSEKIREIDSDVPIIILSAHNEKEFFDRAKNAGISEYLFKPIELQNMIEVLIKSFKVEELV